MMVTRFAREMLLREGLLREYFIASNGFQPKGLTFQQSWFSAQLAKLTIIALRLK